MASASAVLLPSVSKFADIFFGYGVAVTVASLLGTPIF